MKEITVLTKDGLEITRKAFCGLSGMYHSKSGKTSYVCDSEASMESGKMIFRALKK